MKKPKETIYRGIRVNKSMATVSDTLVYVDDVVLNPEPSQKLHNHSPTGFNWGYSGSGPAQLALAILLDYYGDADAPEVRYYQYFKGRTVAGWPQEGDWEISGLEIEAEMVEIMARSKVA